MEKLYKCIVKNEKFEVEYFSERSPRNAVLTSFHPIKDKLYSYTLLNGVEAKMKRLIVGSEIKSKLFVYFDNVILLKTEKEHFQYFADQLNYFSGLTELELKKLQLNKLNSSINTRKEELEKLKLEKSKIETENEALQDDILEIKEKMKEIRNLTSKY